MVGAAMMFLGEMPKAATPPEHKASAAGAGTPSDAKSKWMARYNVSEEELEEVFHFREDGTFDIHDVPGTSKKEKTLNTYTLTGLGRYLATGQKTFDNSLARGFCNSIGIDDATNHATHLKQIGAELGGDKKRGFTLTNVGLKRGAELVKAITSTAT